MDCVTNLGGGSLSAGDVVTVGFVDYDAIGHFHYTSFDALELVARASNEDQKELIDHRIDCSLTLSDADSLNYNRVETGGLAEDDSLSCLTCHTAQSACRC